MAKKHFVRKHVIKHQPKKHTSSQFKGVLPSAYGSPTPNIPSTAGKFNPPGWNQKHDYGTTTKFTQGNTSTQQNPFTQGPPSAAGSPETKLTGGFGVGTGNLYQPSTPPSKGQQPQVYNPSTGYMENAPPPTMVTKTPSLPQHPTSKVRQPTWYATGPGGKTWKGKGKLTLQARKYYADHGVKISSRPPGQPAQQDLSDRYGITTFTQWGDVSTTQQNPFKQGQQGLSDKHGITTYNVDGSVSTNPTPSNLQKNLQAASASDKFSWHTFWFKEPDTASASPEWVDHTVPKKQKPWWAMW